MERLKKEIRKKDEEIKIIKEEKEKKKFNEEIKKLKEGNMGLKEDKFKKIK
jgi:hypothetical protein